MAVRFGAETDDLPNELAFGDWGRLEMSAALDAFQDALDYFDQEDVIAAEKARREMIEAARRYYDGQHVKPLKIKPGEPDDNILINLCRSLVDDSVSWLFGNPETGILQMKIDENLDGAPDADESSGDSASYGNDAMSLLTQVYERAGGFNFFKRLGMRGSVAGHFFIKLVNGDLPRPVVLDPLITAVRTDPADADQVVAYKIEWRRSETDPNTRRREKYIYRQLVVRASDTDDAWLVGDFKTKDRAKRQWIVIQAGGWPYPWSPIVDGPNIEPGWGYYGQSDLEDVAGINDGVNFLSSNTMRILKFHAHPKTILTGAAVEDIMETGIDQVWGIPNENARVNNLEMQSDLASSMAFLDFLKTAFWGIGRGLDPATFKDKVGQITNFGLRVLAIRAIHKAGDKRLTYGKALRVLNSRIFEMAGRPERETVIQWPESLPEDPKDELDRLEREINLDVTSRETASEEIGRSWKVEQARILGEKRERMQMGEYLLEQFDRGAAPARTSDQAGQADQSGQTNTQEAKPDGTES